MSIMDPDPIDYSGCCALALLGLAKVGKTSLANCLLGWNDEKDEAYNQQLALFDVADNNNDGYKIGKLLGQQDNKKILIIDTKSYAEENKIDSSEEHRVFTSIKMIKKLGNVQLFVLAINGNDLYIDSDG